MIKIKHLFDAAEKDDGMRLWVEPIGLCKDLCEWCQVNQLMCQVAPPMHLWEWFEKHPDGYGHFRGTYHEVLSKSAWRPALQQLASASQKQNFTLIHQGDDPAQNTATALYEFIVELQSYCPPESTGT